MKKTLLIISLIYSAICWAAPSRIQSLRFDQAKTQTIYLTPGLGSVVLFPCPLVEVFVGRSEEIKVQISPNDRKSLFLNLKKNASQPTNMICRCSDNRSIFVFDLVPSQNRHQDVVELRSSFGRPEFVDGVKLKPIDSETSKKTVVLKSPIMIEEGKRK